MQSERSSSIRFRRARERDACRSREAVIWSDVLEVRDFVSSADKEVERDEEREVRDVWREVKRVDRRDVSSTVGRELIWDARWVNFTP